MDIRRRLLLAGLSIATQVGAKGWPAKPMRLIVPYPPGDAAIAVED